MAEEVEKQEYGSDSDKGNAAYGPAPIAAMSPNDAGADGDYTFSKLAGSRMLRQQAFVKPQISNFDNLSHCGKLKRDATKDSIESHTSLGLDSGTQSSCKSTGRGRDSAETRVKRQKNTVQYLHSL